MANDVPLRDFMNVRFDALGQRLEKVEVAVTTLTEHCITEKQFKECFDKLNGRVSDLDGKRQKHNTRIDRLETFRKVAIWLGVSIASIGSALLITGLAQAFFR